MEPSSGLDTVIKRRPKQVKWPKQKCRDMSQESLRLSFCVKQTARDVKQMDQRLMILCLARKELSAIVAHHDLVATLGPEAVS
jgi:hypothetical protein